VSWRHRSVNVQLKLTEVGCNRTWENATCMQLNVTRFTCRWGVRRSWRTVYAWENRITEQTDGTVTRATDERTRDGGRSCRRWRRLRWTQLVSDRCVPCRVKSVFDRGRRWTCRLGSVTPSPASHTPTDPSGSRYDRVDDRFHWCHVTEPQVPATQRPGSVRGRRLN